MSRHATVPEKGQPTQQSNPTTTTTSALSHTPTPAQAQAQVQAQASAATQASTQPFGLPAPYRIPPSSPQGPPARDDMLESALHFIGHAAVQIEQYQLPPKLKDRFTLPPVPPSPESQMDFFRSYLRPEADPKSQVPLIGQLLPDSRLMRAAILRTDSRVACRVLELIALAAYRHPAYRPWLWHTASSALISGLGYPPLSGEGLPVLLRAICNLLRDTPENAIQFLTNKDAFYALATCLGYSDQNVLALTTLCLAYLLKGWRPHFVYRRSTRFAPLRSGLPVIGLGFELLNAIARKRHAQISTSPVALIASLLNENFSSHCHIAALTFFDTLLSMPSWFPVDSILQEDVYRPSSPFARLRLVLPTGDTAKPTPDAPKPEGSVILPFESLSSVLVGVVYPKDAVAYNIAPSGSEQQRLFGGAASQIDRRLPSLEELAKLDELPPISCGILNLIANPKTPAQVTVKALEIAAMLCARYGYTMSMLNRGLLDYARRLIRPIESTEVLRLMSPEQLAVQHAVVNLMHCIAMSSDGRDAMMRSVVPPGHNHVFKAFVPNPHSSKAYDMDTTVVLGPLSAPGSLVHDVIPFIYHTIPEPVPAAGSITYSERTPLDYRTPPRTRFPGAAVAGLITSELFRYHHDAFDTDTLPNAALMYPLNALQELKQNIASLATQYAVSVPNSSTPRLSLVSPNVGEPSSPTYAQARELALATMLCCISLFNLSLIVRGSQGPRDKCGLYSLDYENSDVEHALTSLGLNDFVGLGSLATPKPLPDPTMQNPNLPPPDRLFPVYPYQNHISKYALVQLVQLLEPSLHNAVLRYAMYPILGPSAITSYISPFALGVPRQFQAAMAPSDCLPDLGMGLSPFTGMIVGAIHAIVFHSTHAKQVFIEQPALQQIIVQTLHEADKRSREAQKMINQAHLQRQGRVTTESDARNKLIELRQVQLPNLRNKISQHRASMQSLAPGTPEREQAEEQLNQLRRTEQMMETEANAVARTIEYHLETIHYFDMVIKQASDAVAETTQIAHSCVLIILSVNKEWVRAAMRNVVTSNAEAVQSTLGLVRKTMDAQRPFLNQMNGTDQTFLKVLNDVLRNLHLTKQQHNQLVQQHQQQQMMLQQHHQQQQQSQPQQLSQAQPQQQQPAQLYLNSQVQMPQPQSQEQLMGKTSIPQAGLASAVEPATKRVKQEP